MLATPCRGSSGYPADLIVLDLMLPGTNGLETCRQIRARLGRSVAILMVSARGRAGVINCLAAGADDYLAKPFDVAELEARVRTLLRARALEVAAIRRAERLLSSPADLGRHRGAVDEDEILDLVLAEARRLLKSSGVALYQWDAASGLLRPRADVAAEQASPPLPRRPGEGLVGGRSRARAPLWLNDYDNWRRPELRKRAGVVAGGRSPAHDRQRDPRHHRRAQTGPVSVSTRKMPRCSACWRPTRR